MDPKDPRFAADLIIAFAQNQVEMTKSANSRRGVTGTQIRDERRIIIKLFEAMVGRPPTEVEILNVVLNVVKTIS